MWIVLTAKNCNGNGDPNFAIARVGSDTLSVLEGDNVTMTCSFTVNYEQLNILSGLVQFTWFENVMSDELSVNQYYQYKNKIIWSYYLAENRDIFNIDSSEGSTRFIERNHNSSSLMIQNVQSVHDGSYVCAIYTAAVPQSPPIIASDQITLSIHVEPELKVSVEKDWIAENDNVTITCSTPRVKPSVTSMVIKIVNTSRVESEQIQINETDEDKTFANSFSASVNVTRSDNGKRVSCEAIWSSPEENKTISSNTETLRVVWPVDTPENFRVEAWAESCIVTWTRDPNTNNVTVCHNSASSLTNCVKEKENSYIISGLTPDGEYSVWVYASNELGSSKSTAEKMCTPLAITITSTTMATTATTASAAKEVCLNIGIVGGAGGGALGLMIIINIIVIVCFVRQYKKPKKIKRDHTYVNVDKWKKSPQFSASQSATNAEETL